MGDGISLGNNKGYNLIRLLHNLVLQQKTFINKYFMKKQNVECDLKHLINFLKACMIIMF